MTTFNADQYLAEQDPANLLNLVPGSLEYSMVVSLLQGANAEGRIFQFTADREKSNG